MTTVVLIVLPALVLGFGAGFALASRLSRKEFDAMVDCARRSNEGWERTIEEWKRDANQPN